MPTDELVESMIFQRLGSTNQMISIVKPILPNSLGEDRETSPSFGHIKNAIAISSSRIARVSPDDSDDDLQPASRQTVD